MSRLTIIIFISIIFFVGFIYIVIPKNKTDNTSLNTSIVVDISSDKLGISLRPPFNWIIKRQLESQGMISISSGKLTLDNQNTVGHLTVNRQIDNIDRLAPQAWFDKNIAPNVDPLTHLGSGTTGVYQTYSVVANELQKNRHVYVFSGTRVIEVVFPNDQTSFQSDYSDIVTSLRIN